MNSKTFIIIVFSFVLFAECSHHKHHNCQPQGRIKISDYQELAVLYQQQSAEMRALSYQAFAVAKLSIDNIIKEYKGTKPMAIVVDIDETLLDNSPFQAQAILEGFQYPEKWNDWCMLASAKAIPGALEFLLYVRSKDIDIFYISNRKQHLYEASVENLIKVGFPQIEERFILLQTDESCKENRRKHVQKTHEIIMLVGDNINDFFVYTEKKSTEERNKIIDSLRHEFGVKYIMLPNPMYGDWESALYDYNHDYSYSQKDSIRKSKLQGF
jgi:5'-nucleotidase (lipoprotein e(P4) family)